MAALLIRRSFMYGTPRAYKQAANGQEGERRGTSAAATVIEKINHHFRYLNQKNGWPPGGKIHSRTDLSFFS